ncbi:MAG: response regulator, partial [Leptospiraceae bacterium]|nr:response regulator [Leptospiraceae bacterium]
KIILPIQKNKSIGIYKTPLALKFPTINTAYEVIINQDKVTSVGKIGKKEENTIPDYITSLVLLEQNNIKKDSNSNYYLNILIKVSNFHHRNGGVWKITVGNKKHLLNLENQKQFYEIFLLGSILIMGIYHLGLYFQRKKDKSTFWFGIFCILVTLRILLTGEVRLYKLFPENWQLLTKIEYIEFISLFPTFGLFLVHLFPLEFNTKIFRRFALFFFLINIPIIILPSFFYTQLVSLIQLLMLIGGFTSLVLLIKTVKNKETGGRLFFIGVLLIIGFSIHDILHYHQFINSFPIGPIGTFIFIFIQAYVLSIRFSSAFKQVEELSLTMEEQNNKLQEMDKLKDEFLANTSHELRTPLNGIIGIAESLNDGVAGEQSTKAKENLSLIVSSGKRLSNLINDILDFSKLRHKDIQINQKPIDLYSVVNLVLKTSEVLIKNKDLKLINNIPKENPALYADENRIQQILYNIIGNSIKFTEEGEIKVSAEVLENDFVKVIISDTGIGIPYEKLNSIFESFEQVDASNTRKYGGTGLGLSVTKQLVELHGGKIYAESKLGHGSRFIFTLPTTKEKAISENSNRVENHIQEVKENRSEKEEVILDISNLEISNIRKDAHILVVDDEPVNLQVISNHFSFRGYKVTAISNGKEALEFLENNKKPDLVLLDVMMPMMTGFEVCEKIRERYDQNELPILFLTAKNTANDLLEGFNVLGNDYLIKPFSKDELLARTETHIKLKDKVEEIKQISKVKDEFLSNLSHEIKTPLSIVYGYSEMLLTQEDLKKIKKFSGRIHENAVILNNFVSDIILVSDLESGINLEKSNTILNEIIENTIESHRSLIDKKNIEIKYSNNQKIEYNCDKLLLSKAISAVIKNAIVYNNDNGSIEINISSESNNLYFSIKDSGIGISPEYHQKIFEKFFRIDSSLTYEVSGVGLGLFIAGKIIELHGGKIEVNSKLENGSEFVIKLK